MRAFLRNYGIIVVAAIVAAGLIGGALFYASEPVHDEMRVESPLVRKELSEYSWAELALIAEEVARCATQGDAYACAAHYNLCKPDGTLDGTRAKKVQLFQNPKSIKDSVGSADSADGATQLALAGSKTSNSSALMGPSIHKREANVVVAGIWHDTRTDGGKAGLTFTFAEPVGEHAMNHSFEDTDGDTADSVGGWAASDMRTWLNGDLLNMLPLDLRSRIVSVQKPTANSIGPDDELEEAGKLSGTGADWVSQTGDRLWLFSASELCGGIPAKQSLGIDPTMAAIYAAEGGQYRLFSDSGVQSFKPNETLAKQWQQGEPCTWWLRTKTLEFGDGFWLVGTDGTPLNGLGEDERAVNPTYAPDELWGPDHARAVVPGFCL